MVGQFESTIVAVVGRESEVISFQFPVIDLGRILFFAGPRRARDLVSGLLEHNPHGAGAAIMAAKLSRPGARDLGRGLWR